VLPKLSNPVIGVLGVTYKEDTHSIKNSPAVALIRQLRGIPLRSFDPAVKASPEWHDQLVTVDSMEAACDGADCLMIMTPWPAFRELDPAAVKRRMRGRSVIDPYTILDRNKAATAGLDHHVLGAAPNRTGT
jgi:UDPglucose 6-dehydrogenase